MRFRRLLRTRRGDRSDRGASIIEYALLTGAFGLVVIAGLGTLQGEFDTAYDDRQPQYGTPHATNQTTTTAVSASSSTSSSSSSSSSTSTTSTTAAPTTTTTTAPPVNLSYWWHTPSWVTGARWEVVSEMFLLHDDGAPYSNANVTVSYFDINQFPIGTRSGSTDSLGYLQVLSPNFKKVEHQRVFIAVTLVDGSADWDGNLTGWVDKP